ncbi:hypothetical protein BS50DRAFT_568853 [Corynespora cassiicola Philippines]|uniref:C3H1-type domain-containing protein n=1 Tax=Corynespora cassiicola Philippines TaxID=1448308 RepID=A0A2T2P6W4_CORCC|nr:hypothetical protein BS50DRAFT_568853 [Corynespora cassiicola Philippines]
MTCKSSCSTTHEGTPRIRTFYDCARFIRQTLPRYIVPCFVNRSFWGRAMTINVVNSFAERSQVFHTQVDGWLKLVEELQANLVELTEKYEDVCQDNEMLKAGRREKQKETVNLKQQLAELEQSVEEGSFVLMLIDSDADAYIFQDNYYRDTRAGRSAAEDLEKHAREYLEKSRPALAKLPIMVKAFANANGLSKHLVSSDVICSGGQLLDFAKEFSHAQAVSDFVLVGGEKELVDEKIKGTFSQFVKNPTCRHIIFGACHDNGYVRLLEKHVAGKDRITLLQSYMVGKEFTSLPMEVMKMEGVFRNSPLQTPKPKSPVQASTTNQLAPEHNTKPRTWATLAQSASSSYTPQYYPVGTVLVNADGHRIDAQLPAVSSAAEESWKRKIGRDLGGRYCRMHQLGGNCPHGSKGCGYSHDNLSNGEKLAYRKHLRSKPCYTGFTCRDVNCFYGHPSGGNTT